MRRVTLADAAVHKILADEFVCTWLDATGDPEVGVSFAHAPREGAKRLERGSGEHNVQILFLTPRGEVLHAVAGYSPPKDFLQELLLAKKIYSATQAPDVDRAEVVARMERIAVADAHRGPDAAMWSNRNVVSAREFVARNPLLPATRYRPSMMFGPGGGTFFGVGKNKHGLLGNAQPATPATPATPAPPSAVARAGIAEFVRRSMEEWRPVLPARAPAGASSVALP